MSKILFSYDKHQRLSGTYDIGDSEGKIKDPEGIITPSGSNAVMPFNDKGVRNMPVVSE